MKVVSLKPREVNYKDYVKRHAKMSDVSELVTEDIKIVDEKGNIIVLYYKLKNTSTKDLLWACNQLNFSTGTRTSGLKSTSTIFGYEPKKTLRKDFCSATAMAKNQPKAHYIITNFGKELSEIYQKEIPDVYKKHMEIVEDKIKEEWKITNTPFTSGIVNKNNYLAYHFDSGNFKSVYSNMIVLKGGGVQGGHLAIPEYDIALECADNTLVMFDGQNLLHGVTDIFYPTKRAYRYSLVYYSLQQMWNCDSLDEELLRIREVKKLRELKRLKKDN